MARTNNIHLEFHNILALLFVILLSFSPIHAGARKQAAALRRFLHATLPQSATNLLQFNLSTPPCSWTGTVRCSGHNKTVITGIFLQGLGLKGSIPSSTLGEIKSLTHLSLYDNSLESPIPDDFWSLSRLQYLSLSHNNFNEPLPLRLWNITRLARLDLSMNKFYGLIPAQLNWLRQLAYLFLSSNEITGTIPAATFDSLHSLRFIDLSYNRLAGHSVFANLSNLVSLNLSSNLFTGLILDNLQSLIALDIFNNSLAGSLITAFDLSLPKLETLVISKNRFTGSIGNINNMSMPLLHHIDLSSNGISGSIHLVNFSSVSEVTYLDFSSNMINGSIPDSIVMAKKLTHLDISNNNLSGSIPVPFNLLQSLEYIDLSRNSLVGNVSGLLSLHNLMYLNLSYNKGLGCSSALVKDFGSDSFTGVIGCHPTAADIILHKVHIQPKPRPRPGRIVAVIIGCIAALLSVLMVIAFLMCCTQRQRRFKSSLLSLKAYNARKEDSRFMSGPFSFNSNSGPWAANVRNAASVPVVMFEKPLLNLTFADLLRATFCFHKESQVSQGGLGPVYNALLPGDLHVSIKVLIEGRILTNEAAASEFSMLSNIKHPNIVPLLGYCIVGEERLVIYEFMKNGGLNKWLIGMPERSLDMPTIGNTSRDLSSSASVAAPKESFVLTWPIRHKIAIGLARALSFLHHSQIVHRDVKASTVMLDEEFEPHLANTGLSGLLAGSDEALFAGGSPGYAPPEYGQPGGKVSTMGDVFSYGVILLELVTGKKPVGDTYEDYDDGESSGCIQSQADLVSWVRLLMQIKKSHLLRALDARICVDSVTTEQMMEVFRIGYLCTAEMPSKRPTIQQVVQILKEIQPNIMSP